MIDALTDIQKSKFNDYVKKWTDIGLCTKRSNRQIAEEMCRSAYKSAGLKEPKLILWAKSPIGLLITSKLIKTIYEKGDLISHDFASVGDSVGDSAEVS